MVGGKIQSIDILHLSKIVLGGERLAIFSFNKQFGLG